MDRIKFGVCGLGRIGNKHAEFFAKESDKYKLVAGCDIETERVSSFKNKYNCMGYTGYSEFLKNPEIELVIISTRSLDHVSNAEEALAAGKTVLLDKPIAVTSDDFRKIKKLDKEYHGKLFFLHNLRFEPAFQTIQRLVASRVLGDVQVVQIRRHGTFTRRRDWQTLLSCGGGQLSCWGPHTIDHGLQLINSPVKNIWGTLKRVNSLGDADDYVKIMLVGENEVVADLEISSMAAIKDNFCIVYGTRGMLVCPDEKVIYLKYIDPSYRFDDREVIVGNPKRDGSGYGEDEAALIPWLEECVGVKPEGRNWDVIETEIACHLYKTLREGIPFPIKNTDALEVVRITEEVKRQNPQFKWL